MILKIYKAKEKQLINYKVIRLDKNGECYGTHTQNGQLPFPFARFF